VASLRLLVPTFKPSVIGVYSLRVAEEEQSLHHDVVGIYWRINMGHIESVHINITGKSKDAVDTAKTLLVEKAFPDPDDYEMCAPFVNFSETHFDGVEWVSRLRTQQRYNFAQALRRGAKLINNSTEYKVFCK
jgi:hypothetical protein